MTKTPKSKKEARIFMAISNEDKSIIEKYASENGLSVAAVVRFILSQWIQTNNLR